MMTKTACVLLIASAAVGCGPRSDRVAVTDQAWPFTRWSIAKAYTYNFVPYGPGHRLTVFEPGKGLHANIRTEQLLPQGSAEAAARQVEAILGTQLTSSCPFPRHGIVYFDGDRKPVGAISVCFTCEDLIAWPDFDVAMARKAAVDLESAFAFFEHLFARELNEAVFKTEEELRLYLDRQTKSGTGPAAVSTGSGLPLLAPVVYRLARGA